MTAYAKPDWPADTGIMAEAGIVMDADTGTMIFGQNSRQTYYPASITKILTALVVLEHAALDEQVTFSYDAVNNVEEGSGNSLSLETGDVLSVEDCLYAMLLKSSNQAANALAEHVGGSRDGFVEMMNGKIAELGCTGSHFKNPSGLNDPEQLVTPYDMALIAKAAFANEDLLTIASSKRHTIPPTSLNPEGLTFSMEHKLLMTTDENSEFYFPDAVAGKTGYTSLAGNTLVTYAERDGRRLIAVILKGSQPQYYRDTINLLEFGFSSFQNVDVAEQGLSYTNGIEPVTLGEHTYDPSELTYGPSTRITLPKEAAFADAEETLETTLPKDHPEGAVAMLRYIYNERKIGDVYLCLKQVEETEASGTDQTEERQRFWKMRRMENWPAPVMEQIGENQPDHTKKTGSLKGFGRKALTVLAGVIIFAGLVLLAGVCYLVIQNYWEEKRLAERRAARRQRLVEDGCSQEEFERLLEERLNRGRVLEEEDPEEDLDDELIEDHPLEDFDILADDEDSDHQNL
ncbi:MAG: D-alanyl-D-alanine carboxypeptidase family protein [Hungatella sp.]